MRGIVTNGVIKFQGSVGKCGNIEFQRNAVTRPIIMTGQIGKSEQPLTPLLVKMAIIVQL